MKKKLVLSIIFGLLALSLQSFAAPGQTKKASTNKTINKEVNINSASAEQIALSLNGIGHKKAVAIVEHRKKHGLFKNLEELTKVSGIGLKTLEKNKNLIKLGAVKVKKKSNTQKKSKR